MVAINKPYDIKTEGLEDYALRETFHYTSEFALDGAAHSAIARALLESARRLAPGNMSADFSDVAAALPEQIQNHDSELISHISLYEKFRAINSGVPRQSEDFAYNEVLKEIEIFRARLINEEGIPPSTLSKTFVDAGMVHLAMEDPGTRAEFCAVAVRGDLEGFKPSRDYQTHGIQDRFASLALH